MSFEAIPLKIPDVILITSCRRDDPRGYFMETYRADEFRGLGITAAFVQDNEALSSRPGTIRGLHFQKPPHAQAKLVRVLHGAIFDVAVDLRLGSATFGAWVGARLSAAEGQQMFVPRGFAHGYCTIEADTRIAYKCDAYYSAEAEGGVLFSDPDLAIDWPVPPCRAIVSDRDNSQPKLKALATPLVFPNPE